MKIAGWAAAAAGLMFVAACSSPREGREYVDRLVVLHVQGMIRPAGGRI